MQESYVLIGKIHSPQGIRGELYVSIFAEEAAWADQWETLCVSAKEQTAPQQFLQIQTARIHQKQGRWGFVVRLAEVKDRNQAEAMKGMNVYVPEHFLVSEEGEDVYLREVLGFQVIDQERGAVGTVKGFSGNAMQDILVVEGDHGEFEVPFVEPILIEIQKEKQTLLMDIPVGLVAGEEL